MGRVPPRGDNDPAPRSACVKSGTDILPLALPNAGPGRPCHVAAGRGHPANLPDGEIPRSLAV